MATPMFLPDNEVEQVEALKDYLKKLEVTTLSEGISKDGWPAEIPAILDAFKECWANVIPEIECDDVLTTVVALILLVPHEISFQLVNDFCAMCESLKGDMTLKKQNVILSGLNMLIDGLLIGRSKLRVYEAILNCCEMFKFVSLPVTDNDKVAKWLKEWNSTETQQQAIWRRLRDIHLHLDSRDKAADAMIKLLMSYSDVTAVQACDDAIQCIVTAVKNPHVLTMDHILLLKPVKLLEGTPIHNLLTIFVSGSLSEFEDFASKHADFLQQCNLVVDDCRAKIRILAFMQMAESINEISYDEIMKQLRLSDEDVEEFVIEAARQRAVHCKLNQVSRIVSIYGSVPLSFDRERCVRLGADLRRWKEGIEELLGQNTTITA